ncbi:TMAO reductase [Ensifer sp. Root31]|uniref:TMAO reductase system periplasmic protein TorT n=1 Tax=Ensifer sp. Root31 TaxID=1736512 RepID=UPI000710798A|nr:TMAO reductase system periplasmic protein TorT [Ensifer sp. Root31]KQU85644.1 TMAO reductase [Ensifer sp. Root31]
MKIVKSVTYSAVALSMALSQAAAQEAWPPFETQTLKNGSAETVFIKPVDKASKKWKLCILIPHLKDSVWVAAAYGLMEESKRLGLSATLLQAGGFSELPKQLSQFDDCVASGADAILVAPISEAGIASKVSESVGKGIPTISFINPVVELPVTSKIFLDHPMMGYVTGKYLVDALGSTGGNVVAFPGPQGSGWAERYLQGFEKAVKDTPVKVLDVKFGEAGVAEQLRLVEDSLQTYSHIDAIWGTAPTAEAAIGAIRDAGQPDIKIMASYQNQAMLQALDKRDIIAFATEYPVMQGRVAVDLAVRALEKQPIENNYLVVPKMVTQESLKEIDATQVLAPASYKPTFSVE